MIKLFKDIKKEINLFNKSRNYSIDLLIKDNDLVIYTGINEALDIFENVLTHLKYKYNLKVTYCTIDHKFTITQ